MKWRELIRDKAFILFSFFYLFLGLLVLQLRTSSPDKGDSKDYLFSSFSSSWYNEPWVLAVFTAVLILIVASFGTVNKKSIQ